MPDQIMSAAKMSIAVEERRGMKALARRVNSTPTFWRDEDGTLMAKTVGTSGTGWLYRWSTAERRWNDAGRAH